MSFRLLRLSIILPTLALISASAQVANQAPADQTPPPAPAPAAPAGPDYPDPRTFTVGAFFWFTNQGMGANPNVYNGRGSTSEESLPNFGNYHNTPMVEASYPNTRTGVLYLQVFEEKGTGNENSPLTTYPLGLATAITKGDYLANQFQIKDAHIYLDDLLFPHKFPVSRLRFKSLWGFEYFSIHATATNPLVGSPVIADDTRTILLPTFGVAAEYAISKHVLLRISGSGFGIYHRADIGHAEGTLSWRRGPIEIVGGERLLHFKSSPNNAAGYIAGTTIGAFAGVRWHF